MKFRGVLRRSVADFCQPFDPLKIGNSLRSLDLFPVRRCGTPLAKATAVRSVETAPGTRHQAVIRSRGSRETRRPLTEEDCKCGQEKPTFIPDSRASRSSS